MEVSELSQEQLEELRNNYFDQLESEGGEVLGSITSAEGIPMSNVIAHYEGTYFVNDDFFCTMEDDDDSEDVAWQQMYSN